MRGCLVRLKNSYLLYEKYIFWATDVHMQPVRNPPLISFFCLITTVLIIFVLFVKVVSHCWVIQISDTEGTAMRESVQIAAFTNWFRCNLMILNVALNLIYQSKSPTHD